MTAEQIGALATILHEFGHWPLTTVLAVLIAGPWIAMGLVARSIERRHDAAVKMYEENVKLVLNYEKVAEGLHEILVLSTQTMTQVKDKIDANLYCPMMRKDQRVETNRL